MRQMYSKQQRQILINKTATNSESHSFSLNKLIFSRQFFNHEKNYLHHILKYYNIYKLYEEFEEKSTQINPPLRRATSKPHSCHLVYKFTLTSALSQQLTSLVPSGAAFVMFLASQAQFSEFKSNVQRNLRKQICELKRASGSRWLPICQSKYQCCGGSLQSCPEENIRFGCERIFRCKPTDTFSTKMNLFANKSQKKGKKKTPRPDPESAFY